MKGLIYLGLILLFIMFFNTNPMLALVVLGCILGVFLFMRRRKSKASGRFSSGFFGSRIGSSQHQSSFNAVLTLMMLQQMGISEEKSVPTKQDVSKEDKRREEIERQKQVILKLLKSGEDL